MCLAPLLPTHPHGAGAAAPLHRRSHQRRRSDATGPIGPAEALPPGPVAARARKLASTCGLLGRSSRQSSASDAAGWAAAEQRLRCWGGMRPMSYCDAPCLLHCHVPLLPGRMQGTSLRSRKSLVLLHENPLLITKHIIVSYHSTSTHWIYE